MDKCMPTAPKRVGREFVKKYYTIMNKSPENLHCFYTDSASFMHDDIDPNQRRTINANGKNAIRDALLTHLPKYNQTKAYISNVDTSETLNDCLIIQLVGEISYNGSPMRPFSQTIILAPKTPFHYFVQNDIFRFCDFESDGEQSLADEPIFETETMPTNEPTIEPADQSDWGTQCTDYIEPLEESAMAKQTVPRVEADSDTGAPENEVKLDSSDSGLSSDAEKAIVDIQSQNLKNILQEKRTITKGSVMLRNTPTPPPFVEEIQSTIEQHQQQQQQQQQPIETTTTLPAYDQIPENKNSLFRDSCILTIGNTVNPNIEFDDDVKCDAEANKSEMEKAHENIDEKNDSNSSNNSISGGANVSGNSGSGTGKARNRKRKDKRKAKSDTSSEKSSNDVSKVTDPNESQTHTNDVQPADNNGNTSAECTPETIAEKSIKSEPNTATEALDQETPKSPVKKSYADLAKSGTDEWIDEMAKHRDSMTDKPKTRSTLPRRNSRGDRSTPPNDGMGRISPKNDLLQVFIGNIPHSASEGDIHKMFSRFGRLYRFRFHTNTRKEWLPQYAFITYDNIQSVQQCLMKKHTFYWPEHGNDRQKLNVNGDPSVDIWDDYGNQKSNDGREKTREFKRFSKNFNMHSKEGSGKRSPHMSTDIADTMKNERRKSSTRA